MALEISRLFNFNGFLKHIFAKVSTDIKASYVCLQKNAEIRKLPIDPKWTLPVGAPCLKSKLRL